MKKASLSPYLSQIKLIFLQHNIFNKQCYHLALRRKVHEERSTKAKKAKKQKRSFGEIGGNLDLHWAYDNALVEFLLNFNIQYD